MQLACVPPDRVAEVWPHVEEILSRAYNVGVGDGLLETSKADAFSGRSLLWIVVRELKIIGALTTKIIQYPTRKCCLVVDFACRDLAQCKHLISVIEDYARAEGCECTRFEGRRGFQRVFPQYRLTAVVLERKL